jgi:hypothetical protein
LHPTNGDGTQAATFGFELSEDPDFEYPLILRVEAQSPAEGAGLQSRDVLLKINERKTKGLGYDKVKKEIEKAKRDGRLEMLVVDQETLDYCKRTKRPMKEPEMKVKHIFPKSRSSASFHKLPIAAAASSLTTRDSVEQLSNIVNNVDERGPIYRSSLTSTSGNIGYHLHSAQDIESENEDDTKIGRTDQNLSPIIKSQDKSTRNSQATVNFDLSTSARIHAFASAQSHESPVQLFDSAHDQRGGTASMNSPHGLNGSRAASSSIPQNSTRPTSKESKSSKTKALPNAISSLINKIGHSKSSKRS